MKAVGCLLIAVLLAFNVFVGTGCARICYRIIFAKQPSTSVCVVTALFAGEIVIPASLGCALFPDSVLALLSRASFAPKITYACWRYSWRSC